MVPVPRPVQRDGGGVRDLAVGQHQHPVGECQRLVHVVRDEQHRGRWCWVLANVSWAWNTTDTGPLTTSSPVTARSSPASARSRVDFPVPLRPIMATMPVVLTICQSARTAIGLSRRSQPFRRPVRPRPGRAAGRLEGAAVTPAIGRLPGPAVVPAAGSAGLPRPVALVLVGTGKVDPPPCSGLNRSGALHRVRFSLLSQLDL